MHQLSISQLKNSIAHVVGLVRRILKKKELQMRNMTFDILSRVTATQYSIIEYSKDQGILSLKMNPFL